MGNGLPSGFPNVHPDVATLNLGIFFELGCNLYRQIEHRVHFFTPQRKEVRFVPPWNDECVSDTNWIAISNGECEVVLEEDFAFWC